MKPNRRGQIVKFHTPYHDEDPEQLYVVLEYIEDGSRSRAKIQAAGTGLSFPPVSLVLAEDLEVDEGQTFELDYYLKHGNHGLF
ncbi:hypothetical protein JJL45_01965 [Tamlana sp. s12]|uniref:hypothetical protein n=1 Tax=Tamlana sp. s12 TaxID=1630406 RepID=UPI0007FDDB48|nr:hypothetical protein [Tamlana sp. s12]OBQ57039.1 hypothetical protein VQ01_00705 [Tamlana sp. s12]QQY82783.1 hypothetical protein JJL45_01965 [Tamlana sp. s12]